MNDKDSSDSHMNAQSIENNKTESSYINPTFPPYDKVVNLINEELVNCPDVVKRKVNLKSGKEGFFIYVQGLVNLELLLEHFINPILSMEYGDLKNTSSLESKGIPELQFYYDINEIVIEIMIGNAIFVADGLNFAISTRVYHTEKRSVHEPVSEKSIKGSHEGFIEEIETNISLLRKMIKNNNLKFHILRLGKTTHQTVVIAYIQNIANNELLNILLNKIKSINFDGLIDTGYITQMITDFPLSLIPQYQDTERVDKATAALLEGRFVVMVDGSPTASVVPVSYSSYFSSPDDYNANWLMGSFLRTLRSLAMITALILPSIYIAIVSYHYYMVPLDLLVTLARARARVPFPPLVEALMIEITIELLREAATRLPTYIGSTIGVVGGIVIGQAASAAGIVSEVLLIVVAVTSIAAYVIPSYEMGFAIRIIRFGLMLLAGILGIIGIAFGITFFICHLMVLESLGQPFLQPIAPFKRKDLKDLFLRLPMKYLKKRPDIAKPIDKERGKNNDGS